MKQRLFLYKCDTGDGYPWYLISRRPKERWTDNEWVRVMCEMGEGPYHESNQPISPASYMWFKVKDELKVVSALEILLVFGRSLRSLNEVAPLVGWRPPRYLPNEGKTNWRVEDKT